MSRRGTLSREVVAAAAADLMDAAGGPDALTLAEVAGRFNVKVPSLYNHVSGIDDLRDAVAVHTYTLFYNALRDAAVGRTADDALMAIALTARQFAHEHPGIYPLLLRLITPAGAAQAQRLLDLLIALLRPYGLSEEDSLHAIRGLRSVMHGFVDIERAGGFGLPLDLDESYRRLVAMFITGLHAAGDANLVIRG
jgi:AcrR family transcriptional regulator